MKQQIADIHLIVNFSSNLIVQIYRCFLTGDYISLYSISLAECDGPVKHICSGHSPAELNALLPDESRRSLSFSASAHLQTEAHLSPLPPECSWRWLDYTLHTAMQSTESLSVRCRV